MLVFNQNSFQITNNIFDCLRMRDILSVKDPLSKYVFQIQYFGFAIFLLLLREKNFEFSYWYACYS